MRDWLAKNGWSDVFLDFDPERGLAPGERWRDGLKKAADRCQAVLLLISPEWLRSRWCLAEFLLARQLGKRIFPILIGNVALDRLPAEMTANHQAVDLVNDPRAYQRLKEGLKRAGLDPNTFPFAPGRRPYPGFEPLTEDDAAVFFGREAQIVRCLDRLRTMSEAGVERLLIILGASGAGKSSFLRAGLWPRLKRDDRNFLPLPVMRPERGMLTGKFGLYAGLEAALAEKRVAEHEKVRSLPHSQDDIADLVQNDPDALAKILATLREASDTAFLAEEGASQPAVIISIDQAEELFNDEGRAEAESFLDLLARALAQDRRLLVAMAIRSDAFPRLQVEPALAEVGKEPFDLPPLPAGSLRLVIEGPARVANPPLVLEPKLVDALLADAASPDSLPLLAFTLGRLLREHSGDGRLDLAEYEGLGRLSGAVNAAVAEVIQKGVTDGILPSDEARLAALLHEAFVPHLARVDRTTHQFVRRVAAKAEVPREAHALVDRFVEARLLVKDRRPTPSGEAEVVEVAHEALLREWPLLHGWLEADRDFLLGKEQLAEDIVAWRAAERQQKPEALLSGLKLARARLWLRTRPAQDLSSAEREFINLSIARADAAQRRKQWFRALAASVLIAVTAAAVWQAFEASQAKSAAVHERDVATERLALARGTATDLVALITQDLRKVQGIQVKTVQRMLAAARRSFDNLSAALSGDPTFQGDRARMMSGFGEAYMKAGGLAKAEKAYSEALSIYRALAAKDGKSTAWQRGIADQLDNIGVLRQKQNRPPEAWNNFQAALSIRKEIAVMAPRDAITHGDLASSYYNLGEVALPQGRTDEAYEDQKSALASIERALSLAGGNTDLENALKLKLSLIHTSLGTIYEAQHREPERLKSLLASVAIRQELVQLDPDNVEWKRMLSWAHCWLGGVYADQNNSEEALKSYRACLGIRQDLVRSDPDNRQAQYDLAWAYHYAGEALQSVGKADEAAEHRRYAYKIRQDLAAADPTDARVRKDLALSSMDLGDIAQSQRDPDGALRHYQAAREVFKQLSDAAPEAANMKAALARVMNRIARVLKEGSDIEGAADYYSQALAIRRELLARHPDGLGEIKDVATSLFLVGEILNMRGDKGGALAKFHESQDLRKMLAARDATDTDSQSELTKLDQAIAELSAQTVHQ